MSKYLNRFKNWLIKKLGGYTKEEYSVGTINHFEFIPANPKKFQTITTEGEYDIMHAPPQEWIENRLLGDISQKINQYVVWEHTYNELKCTKVIRASLKVVDPHE